MLYDLWLLKPISAKKKKKKKLGKRKQVKIYPLCHKVEYVVSIACQGEWSVQKITNVKNLVVVALIISSFHNNYT